MNYAYAYFKTFRELLAILGSIYLISTVLHTEELLPSFLLYLCTVTSIAGPIALLFKNNKKDKVSI